MGAMTLPIVSILILGYLLIATESVTRVNKATVAILACTMGWVLYICYGTDFVMSQHAAEYAVFLDGRAGSSVLVKEFIASNIFLKYTGKACEIVLFLLATRAIVEVLDYNQCFDFIRDMLRTRNSKRMLWMLGIVTWILSANLDNLTTAIMMLVVMRKLVPSRRQRLIYGASILIACNCGGVVTVIGSPTGLMLWNAGLVTASHYFLVLFVPCLVAWAIPTWWLGRALPERVESEMAYGSFRGDDSKLAGWQKLVMLVLGIGGLWFIPTFHNITKLSSYLGALCVLAVIWVVNEIFNHKRMKSGGMEEHRIPEQLLSGSHQLVLFVLGIMLALGVVCETGVVRQCWDMLQQQGASDWVIAMAAGILSSVIDNFATSASFITLNPSGEVNADYWYMITYMTAIGGNVLTIGSMAGVALMQAEKMHVGWYFSHVGWKVVVGMVAGFGTLMLLMM